ncbi:MAG TPA: HEAT repeat domain-containing protein [Gemmatimonadales bacterium]|nr:HEAT repeat domain-containing protein [Gemmatimonadales bacterium]
MTALNLIPIVASAILAVGLLTVLVWVIYTWYLVWVERNLAARKGLYLELVSDLGTRDRALLQPTIRQMSTLYDLDALEGVLDEQARSASGRVGWLLDVYDELGLVDKYIDQLRSAGKGHDRAFAAELLGRVGGAKAVPALLETVVATRTEDSDVRDLSLRALSRIADPQAVQPLIRALETADTGLAPRIADILTRHGEAVVDPLITLLDDGPPQPARAWATHVLGEVRAQRAFPSLVRLLGDTDDEVKAKAATALGRMGDRRAVGCLLEHLLTDPGLGDLLSPEELLSAGARALEDPSPLVRQVAVTLFNRVSPDRALPRLIQVLRVDDDTAVLAAAADLAEKHFRVFTATALAVAAASQRAVLVTRIARHIVHPDLPQLIAVFAQSTSPEVRCAIAELWRNRPDIVDAASLHAMTQDPDIAVRRSAAAAVLAAGQYDLLDTMSQDSDSGVRREVALALGRAAPVRKPGVATLERLATDEDMVVRAAAYVARLLQGLPLPLPPELDTLVAAEAVRHGADLQNLRQTALTDPSEERRLSASLALALLQDDVAREVARRDPAPAIRHRVAGALELSIGSAVHG